MHLKVNKEAVYVGTGGREHPEQAAATVVLLHGSGMDHRAWTLQSRWYAR